MLGLILADVEMCYENHLNHMELTPGFSVRHSISTSESHVKLYVATPSEGGRAHGHPR